MYSNNEGLSFKSVVINFLYRMSDMSSKGQDLTYLLDSLWMMLQPFVIEEDKVAWSSHATNISYDAMINRIRIISLVLYRNSLLPHREYITNRKYDIPISSKSRSSHGLRSHVIEDIRIDQFFMRHLILVPFIIERGGCMTFHLDVLWSMLSPYITEEDYDTWKSNDITYAKISNYMWTQQKIAIVMTVMDRAEFLWKTGSVDEPVESLAILEDDYNAR